MKLRIRQTLLAVAVVLVAMSAWLAYRAYSVYSDISATYHPEPRISPEPKATQVADFFGYQRINFLVLGSDNDTKSQEKHPLTQSMIVVSVDPVHDKVNMLSIPRDFWVNIPGHGMGKIDLAAKFGWVPLARATVENLFHINIDYYAWVGLSGFTNVINVFGGITINVTHPILDDFYPNDQTGSNPYAYTRVFIPPGWRHLSGRQALEYVRSRHGDAVGDFGRSERQQQVLLQLRKKANGFDLLFKIPQLAHDLRYSVQTDLDLSRLLDVARLARHIRPSDIHRVILSVPAYCHYATTPDGQSILVPNWRAINPVVRQLFAPIRASNVRASQPQSVSTPKPGPTAAPARSSHTSPRPTSSPAPTPTPVPAPLGRLPGKLVYAAGGSIYEMDRNHRVYDLLPSWMTAADMPAISPDEKSLAFMRWSTYASDIYTSPLRGGATPTQITHDASPDPHIVNNYMWASWPSWSQDGKTILFSSDRYKLQSPPSESRKLDLAIYATSADGSHLRQLTVPAWGAGGDTDPQFRGHSSQYLYDHWAYTVQNGLAVGQPYSQLMLRDINNLSSVWPLTPPGRQIVQPALDRAGSQVAYVEEGKAASRIVVAHILNGKKGPQLTGWRVIAGGEVTQPAFTPDGRWVSYLQADGDNFSLYLQSLQGATRIKISQVGQDIDALSRPVWIP